MTPVLKRVALVFSIGLLLISIRWSKDGFNFTVAGDAGGTTEAIAIGYFIAAAMTVLQFVFSTHIKNLNASLIVFGLIAYGYSIWTNYEGIIGWQGTTPNRIMAFVLGLGMDGVPEPLMAWALGESLSGDFIGNIFKGFGAFLTGKPLGSGGGQQQRQDTQPKHGGNNNQGKGGGSERRRQLEMMHKAQGGGGHHGPDRREGERERERENPQNHREYTA